jgi:hypothetical protein
LASTVADQDPKVRHDPTDPEKVDPALNSPDSFQPLFHDARRFVPKIVKIRDVIEDETAELQPEILLLRPGPGISRKAPEYAVNDRQSGKALGPSQDSQWAQSLNNSDTGSDQFRRSTFPFLNAFASPLFCTGETKQYARFAH